MSYDELDLQQQLEARKDDVLDLVKMALRAAGLHNLDIKSIHVDMTRRAPICPPGKSPVWEAVPQPDGSIVYKHVCK
ncbi:MAG TPA: hypothetical protein VKC34_10070 [Blastocatellia bacterium]|nr:hypothetical protein [Blastocatellia bacterium]